jgi:hypothetical protein
VKINKLHTIEILLFLSAFAFFSIFAPLGQVVSDTAYSVETAKSLVYRKSLSIDKNWVLRFAKPGQNGKYYSKYGLGYALSFVPQICAIAALSKVLPFNRDYLERFVLSFTNTFYASCIAVVFFMLLIRLGYRPKICFATVFALSCSSILLPYSKIIQSETLTTLLLLMFLYYAAGAKKIGFLRGALLGFIVSVLYCIKIPNIILSAVIAAYVAFQIKKGNYTPGGIVAFLIVSVAPLCMIFYFNEYRFGSLLNFGYGAEQSQFSTPIYVGLCGFLFSPSKSLFIFSPLIILGLFGIKKFYDKHRTVAIAILSLTFLDIVFYARWHDWQGGWAWGPRLIVPVMILLHIFCIEFFTVIKKPMALKILFVILLTWGIGIQFLGSMISYQQIHYFYSDPYSIKMSQIALASKLLVHKIQGKKEMYSGEDFAINSDEKPYMRDGKMFGGKVYNFEDRGTFLGFSTLWSGLHHNFGWKYIEYFPLVLLLVCIGFGHKAWKTIPSI